MPPARVEVIVTEYATDRPWIVVGTRRDVIEADAADLWEAARARWPSPRFGVRPADSAPAGGPGGVSGG